MLCVCNLCLTLWCYVLRKLHPSILTKDSSQSLFLTYRQYLDVTLGLYFVMLTTQCVHFRTTREVTAFEVCSVKDNHWLVCTVLGDRCLLNGTHLLGRLYASVHCDLQENTSLILFWHKFLTKPLVKFDVAAVMKAKCLRR